MNLRERPVLSTNAERKPVHIFHALDNGGLDRNDTLHLPVISEPPTRRSTVRPPPDRIKGATRHSVMASGHP